MPPYRILNCLSLAILPIALLFVGPAGTLAQSTTANCVSSYYWMYNTKSQSPCLIAAYLINACLQDNFTVYALLPGNYSYVGPPQAVQDPCTCSSVTYIAHSACGLCQNHPFISWSAWATNCTPTYPGVFPPGIPDGIVVPQWMFQDVTKSNTFNVTLAQSVGDSPESTATQAQSTDSLSTTSALTSASQPIGSLSAASTPVTTLLSAASSVSSGSHSEAGVIAGSVVGSVIAGALISGGIAVFILKKRRSRPEAIWQPNAVYTDPAQFGLGDRVNTS